MTQAYSDQNDIREFLHCPENPVMFSLFPDWSPRPLPATHVLQITGVMDWQELIIKPNSNKSFDY